MEMSAAGGLRLRVTSGMVLAAGRAGLQPPASHLGNGAVNWHVPPNPFRQLRVSCNPPRGVHLCGSIRSPDGCLSRNAQGRGGTELGELVPDPHCVPPAAPASVGEAFWGPPPTTGPLESITVSGTGEARRAGSWCRAHVRATRAR